MAIKKLGKIVNFFGLKGQLKVSVTTSTAEERFKKGKKIIIKNEMNEDETFTITSSNMKNPKIAIIAIEGYDDINQIQKFIGRDIYANVKAPEGEFFYDDLVGMDVYTNKDALAGKVTNVVKMPAGDYLLLDNIYIPFKKDTFIQSVDKKEKKIVLTELGSETLK